jgi:Tol biopolymer transport system component
MSRQRKITLAFVTLVALAAASPAMSTTGGTNGLIVYTEEFRPDQYQLFTIHPDGSGAKQITHAVNAGNPDWSPRGDRIVAELETNAGGGITLMSAEGRRMRNLTPKGEQGQPSFSPDGRWIAYERDIADGNNGVWLMRATDGKGLRRVTRNPFGCCDTDPNFSPDGKMISFVRVKTEERLQALFSVRRDGTRLRQLTPYSWDVAAKHDWSPDGRLILLTINTDLVRPGESVNIVTIHPDGSGRHDLTQFKSGQDSAFAGSFSPDGKQIVFRLESAGAYSLAIANVDGSNLQRLTTGEGRPRFIDWGTHR